MFEGRGARDRRSSGAVEAPSGRSTFDGNHTKNILAWVIPFVGMDWTELDQDQLDTLMAWTLRGHLAWVVFPISNVSPE